MAHNNYGFDIKIKEFYHERAMYIKIVFCLTGDHTLRLACWLQFGCYNLIICTSNNNQLGRQLVSRTYFIIKNHYLVQEI